MGLKRPFASLLLVASFVAAAAGATTASASSTSTTSTTTPSTGVVVKNGGTVTVAVPYLPSEFNPSTPSGENSVTSMIMAQVWPQPFVVNGSLQAVVSSDSHGQPGLLGPSGAELESVHPETVVYNINPGAKWSDGVPITAADFAYNWHEQLAIGSKLAANDPLIGYSDIKSVKGSNKGKTVTVVFSKPYADWEALFSNLAPAHIGEQFGWAAAFASFDAKKVISGGPFIITKMVPGKELVLSRNKKYWGNPPQLSHIVFKVLTKSSDIVAGLQNGSIDIAQLSPGPGLAQLSIDPDIKVSPALTPTMLQLSFNLANAATASVNVREAIASAVDRSQLISNTIGFLTPFSQATGNRLYGAGAPGSQGNSGPYSQVDVEQTQDLFAAIGDVVGSDGLLHSPDGSPVVFNMVGPGGSPLIQELEDQLQAQLLAAGIQLRVTNVPLSQLLTTILPKGQYEIALTPFTISPFPSTTETIYTDPVGPTPIAASNFVPVPSSTTKAAVIPPTAIATIVSGNQKEPGAASFGAVTRNVFGFKDPAITPLYTRAISQLNASSASALYNQIDSALWVDMPTFPLFQMPVILASRADLVNVNDTQTLAGPLWNAQNWAIQLNPPTPTTTTP